ncbi:hypothetical protein SDC9_92747 [bioreactor metagenome]|uniref:Uncharacterized protein n=2 Tax=root TaxID=1 RepID=A0A1W1IHJ2_9LACT|nr:hypothetical protein [Trichococcus pasteurii]SFE51573.1 hypothetical protein SAMN04488086_10521 [Trichococcus pasteurii]SLM52464.1 Hypothetical protein TPAS_2158 [Trichococcus pasteurii]SSB93345.1 Hypothetical protein TPAS_2158 [Trichococcus pasteurii]
MTKKGLAFYLVSLFVILMIWSFQIPYSQALSREVAQGIRDSREQQLLVSDPESNKVYATPVSTSGGVISPRASRRD